MLEVLVHANLSRPPKNQQAIRILVPEIVSIESINSKDLPGWDAEDLTVARTYGDAWLLSRRTAVLRVPGVITQGRESNIVLNTQHPQFGLITAEAPEPIHWDARLFHSPMGLL
jgi:RES domain-containing protein